MAKGKAKKNVKAAPVIGMDKKADENRLPIVDNCEGCERIEEINGGKYCSKYADPSFHWENDQICSFATHVKRETKVAKKMVNPLKASKRLSKK